jgi:O-succinylbenzoic acid--CoA ligase
MNLNLPPFKLREILEKTLKCSGLTQYSIPSGPLPVGLNGNFCFLEAPVSSEQKDLATFIYRLIQLRENQVRVIPFNKDFIKAEILSSLLPNGFIWKNKNNQPNQIKGKPVDSTIAMAFKDAGFAFFSSGSSGVPKLIFHKEESLIQSAFLSGELLALPKKDGRIISSLPLNHVGGFLNILRSGLFSCSFELRNPQNLFQNLKKNDVVVGVPAQIKHLPQEKGLTFYAGGDKVTKEQWQNSSDQGIQLISTYGQTESGGAILYQNEAGNNIQLFKDIKIKETLDGTLSYKTNRLAIGQISYGQASKFNSEEFFETSDLIELKNNNTIKFLGRKDLNFQCGGEMISPSQIENRITDTLKQLKILIFVVKVIGIPDDRLGKVPVAFFESQDNLDLENIAKLLAPLEKGPAKLRYLSIIPRSTGIKPTQEDYNIAFKQLNIPL